MAAGEKKGEGKQEVIAFFWIINYNHFRPAGEKWISKGDIIGCKIYNFEYD